MMYDASIETADSRRTNWTVISENGIKLISNMINFSMSASYSPAVVKTFCIRKKER